MSVWQENTLHIIERHEGDAYAAGLGDIWNHVLEMDPSASRTMLLGIVGALATCLCETDYHPPA